MLRMIARTPPALIGAMALLTLLPFSVALASGNDQSPTLTPVGATADTPSAAAGHQSANDEGGSAAMSEQIKDHLDLVRQRGHLVCASSDAIPGFGYLATEENGGFDVDLCRGVAAALGDRQQGAERRPSPMQDAASAIRLARAQETAM